MARLRGQSGGWGSTGFAPDVAVLAAGAGGAPGGAVVAAAGGAAGLAGAAGTFSCIEARITPTFAVPRLSGTVTYMTAGGCPAPRSTTTTAPNCVCHARPWPAAVG